MNEMICEKCNKIINEGSRTPEEAMKKYTARLKKESKKYKEKNDTSKQSKG